MLCYAILCIILYYTILYYITSHYIILLYYIVLYYIISYCVVLYCIVFHHIIWYYMILYCIYIIHYQIMCMYIYIYTFFLVHDNFPCSEIDHQKLACALCPLSNRPSWEGHRIPIWGCGQRGCKLESVKLKPQRRNGGNPQSHRAPPLQPSVVHCFTDRRASNHRNCRYTVDRLWTTQLCIWMNHNFYVGISWGFNGISPTIYGDFSWGYTRDIMDRFWLHPSLEKPHLLGLCHLLLILLQFGLRRIIRFPQSGIFQPAKLRETPHFDWQKIRLETM